MGPRGRFYSYMYLVNVDWDRCSMGRAPHTKETLPNFHEWCRVNRHPRVFRGLTGSQQTPGNWGVTVRRNKLSNMMRIANKIYIFFDNLSLIIANKIYFTTYN